MKVRDAKSLSHWRVLLQLEKKMKVALVLASQLTYIVNEYVGRYTGTIEENWAHGVFEMPIMHTSTARTPFSSYNDLA